MNSMAQEDRELLCALSEGLGLHGFMLDRLLGAALGSWRQWRKGGSPSEGQRQRLKALAEFAAQVILASPDGAAPSQIQLEKVDNEGKSLLERMSPDSLGAEATHEHAVRLRGQAAARKRAMERIEDGVPNDIDTLSGGWEIRPPASR